MAEAALPLLLMAGSTAMQYTAAKKQGKMQKKRAEAAAMQARAQAAYDRQNAKLALQEAKAEQEASIAELKQHRRASAQKMAKLRAKMGASGLTPSGSPLLVEEDTASELALEHAWLGITGARRAKKWRGQALLDMKKSKMSMTRSYNLMSSGRDYASAGKMKAGAALLGGGAQAAYMAWTPTTGNAPGYTLNAAMNQKRVT